MTDWPHQTYAVEETRKMLRAGLRRLLVAAPTGAGKSRMMQRMIEWGLPTVVYANRVMLIEQLARGMDDANIPYGMQASGYAPSVFENVQIASIQTVASRFSKGTMLPHEAKLVILDEAHNEKAERCKLVMDWHLDNGGSTVLFTATPVSLGHMADKLIQAGVNSELRKCGALVAAQTFAPDEPSTKAFKTTTKGLLQFKDEVKEVMLPVIFGRVIEHYRHLNPEQKPSILFAPGVDESRWFTEKLNHAGIPWSHIDGNRLSINGHDMAATRENRMMLLEASKSGRTKGISNRFVMREGIDCPWFEHMIFACTYGSLQAYLQSGGRGLRACEGKSKVVVQDHGGNFHRFDSLNADRVWDLDDTDKKIQEKHDEEFRTKEKEEPIVCPKCAMVRSKGVSCPQCGFTHKGKRRIVIETDGTLREVKGDIYRPRRVNNDPEAHKKWKECFYRSKNANRTLSQARATFMREMGGTVPGPGFPLMPIHEADWALKVRDIPYERLSKGGGQ
jgi:DNA repair protein RadD